MFRILIVDDEPHVIDTMVALLEAQTDLALDIYCAGSGKKAIEIMEKGKIDILVTDIKMPDLTGIELADTVNRLWPFCKILFLTAHSDFNYAYEAFKKNAVSYILKTEEDDFIIQEIRKTIRSIEDELDKKQALMEIEQSRKMHVDPVRRNLFFRLLTNGNISTESMHDFYTMLGYSEPPSNLFLVFGLLKNSFQAEEMYYGHNSKTTYPGHYYIVTNLIAHYMHSQLLHSVCEIDDNNLMVFLLQTTENNKPTEKHHSQWLADILETVQSSYLATAGTDISFLIYPVSGKLHLLSQIYEDGKACISKLCQNEEKFIITSNPAAENTKTDCNLFDNLIFTLKNYIDANIFGDVSLMKLSSVTGYNAAYLSGLFHKQTGEMLHKYITRKKLERIDQLFLNTSLDINAVAKQAGFSSISYFNRFIKKETGLTPKIYQMNLLSQK